MQITPFEFEFLMRTYTNENLCCYLYKNARLWQRLPLGNQNLINRLKQSILIHFTNHSCRYTYIETQSLGEKL